MKSLLIVFISFFLVSCSSKSALNYFDKSDLEARAFQESKKGDYIEDGSPKIIVWATYLNNVDSKKYKNKEYFLVSVYTSNSDIQSIEELNYEFSLNGELKEDLKAISKDDDILKLISKNNWGSYYLLTFAESEDYTLSLKLTKESSDLINLSFLKDH